MTNTWIVVAGGPPAWDACGSRALRMAEAFQSLGHKVLYIESGGVHDSFLQVADVPGEDESLGLGVVPHLTNPGFFVMRASHLPFCSFTRPEIVRRLNCARTSARASQFLAASKASSVIVFHYGWQFYGLFREARRSAMHVYECAEDYRSLPGIGLFRRRQIERIEGRLFSRSGLVVFSSEELAKSRSPKGASAVVPLAVDADHFGGPVRIDPHHILGINHHPDPNYRRIGFFGELRDPAEAELLRAAASETPGWHWIIIGPHKGIRAQGPPNLHWMGAIPYDEIAAWLQHWDAAVLPLSPHSDFNRRISPASLLECLAAGLPVATTAIPAALRLADQVPELVKLASEYSSASLVDAVQEAVAVPPERREIGREFARRYTWKDRASEIMGLVETAKASTPPEAD